LPGDVLRCARSARGSSRHANPPGVQRGIGERLAHQHSLSRRSKTAAAAPEPGPELNEKRAGGQKAPSLLLSAAPIMETAQDMTPLLADVDPEVARAIDDEVARQTENVNLIASENLVSEAVLEAMGSVFTNKY